MRRVTLAFLVIGNLLAGQAHAEDVAAQPLTRSDCDKAAMSWDDNANVCVQARGGVKSMLSRNVKRYTKLFPVFFGMAKAAGISG